MYERRSVNVTTLFSLGRTLMTRGALAELTALDVRNAIGRHMRGDWGIVCADDRYANDRALVHEGRLLSVYESSNGKKFWIITEWDRSATTVLLPDEY